jgi:hypothetical protein
LFIPADTLKQSKGGEEPDSLFSLLLGAYLSRLKDTGVQLCWRPGPQRPPSKEPRGMSVNEYEASLIVRAGAELLHVASSDPRSDQGYEAVKANLSEALESMAEALANFEAGLGVPSRSTGWVQDLHRVADDLGKGRTQNGTGRVE